MAIFQPPPTWAEVILVDEKTKKATFNPIWLKWFVELVGIINATGGGGGVIQHNTLGGLQGGAIGQYYHFTQAAYTFLNGTLTPSNGGILWSDATKVNVLAGVAAAGRMLRSGNSATPSWSTSAWPTAAGAAGHVPRSNATDYVDAALAAADLSNGTLGSGNVVLDSIVGAWLTSWTPTRTNWTDVGAPTVTARYCRLRNVVFFQVKVVPGTTTATTGGTSYIDLPIAAGASGLSGDGSMLNESTLVGVGNVVFDIANSRCYVPTQAATGSTLGISGWYEV